VLPGVLVERALGLSGLNESVLRHAENVGNLQPRHARIARLLDQLGALVSEFAREFQSFADLLNVHASNVT